MVMAPSREDGDLEDLSKVLDLHEAGRAEVVLGEEEVMKKTTTDDRVASHEESCRSQ